jgi:hypothetical protein
MCGFRPIFEAAQLLSLVNSSRFRYTYELSPLWNEVCKVGDVSPRLS